MIVHSRLIPPRGFAAINLMGILFVRRGESLTAVMLCHERIHTRQMLELLIVPFYLLYVLEWLVRLLARLLTLGRRGGRSVRQWLGMAYRDISFEREAYGGQSQAGYLKTRRAYAWVSHLRPLLDG